MVTTVDSDDETLLGSEWKTLCQPAGGLSVRYQKYTEPTEHFEQLNTVPTVPYTNASELFCRTLEINDLVLAKNQESYVDSAWEAAVRNAVNGGFDDDTRDNFVIHCLRMAQTPPSIFGESGFKFNTIALRADLSLKEKFDGPLDNDSPFAGRRDERHDVACWFACLKVFGKCFSMDGWDKVADPTGEPTVEALTTHRNPQENILKVTCAGTVAFVQKEGMVAMVDAIDSMSNQPTIFYRGQYAVDAVCKILGKERLSYVMPQTPEDLASFDWNNVIPGRPETYPVAPQPSEQDFSIVKAVHQTIKDQKDTRARLQGRPNAGVLSYCSYKQRWKRLRDDAAVYRHMNPTSSLQTAWDIMVISMKNRKSKDDMDKALDNDIKRHKAKLKREATKKRKQDELKQQLTEAAAKESEVVAVEEEANEDCERLQQEKRALQAANFQDGNTRKTRQQINAERKSAVDDVNKKLLEAAAIAAAASCKAKELSQEKQRLEEEAKKVAASKDSDPPLAKKPRILKQMSALDQVTPRMKAQLDGDAWLPPKIEKVPRRGYTMSKSPGHEWTSEMQRKYGLLTSLHKALKDHGCIGQPLAFQGLMELLGVEDDEGMDFYGKLFLHAVALVLNQKSSVNDVALILIDLLKAKLATVEEISKASAAKVQAVINQSDHKNNKAGATVHALAVALVDHFLGVMPLGRAGLKEVGLDDAVVDLLSQQAFGSTVLVVGVHTRKILTALDMLDWEATGATSKANVKIADVDAKAVRLSLKTWIPKGEGSGLHHVMDSIGCLLCHNHRGLLGSVKAAINRHFAAKDKKEVEDMVTAIMAFYTVSRKRRKPVM